jgi:hypothetical protein
MRTGLRALLAVPLLVGLAVAPAHADWRGYHRGWGPGPVIAGILGLGVAGAVIAHAVAPPPPVYYAPPPAYYPPPPPVYYAPPPPPRAYYYPGY